jgi:type-F conjugative transfer system pilin assembly protein TrbC
MKRTIVGFCLMAGLSSVFAQEAADPASEASDAVAIPPDIGKQLSASDYLKAQQLGATLAKQALGNLDSEQGREFQQQAQVAAAPMMRRADDIADAGVAKERDGVLQFLGINPQASSALYYMVSWSMPLEMLRSYAAEAMWDGGVLVFRGIPEGMDLNTYIHSDLAKLLYGKGASATVSIDPRLFEAYDVQTVPTIVLTTDRRQLNCDLQDKTLTIEGVPHVYKTCKPLDPKSYWKIEGAVTSDFALREFEKAGSSQAQMYLDALAKAGRGGAMAPKDQLPYTGDWKDAISPEDVQAEQDAIARAQSTVPQTSTTPSLTDSLQNAAAAALQK